MRASDDRRHVVLAMRLEADVAQHDHVVITFDFLEGAGQIFFGILRVTREPVLISADDTARRIEQAFPQRIVACPTEQRANGVFGLGARWFYRSRPNQSVGISAGLS